MAYGVTTADIEARWRPLSAAEDEVAFTLLQDAETKLNAYRPQLPTAVAENRVPLRIVVDVLVDMVQRVLRNPDVIRAQNVSSDGSVGLTYGMGEDTIRANMRLQVTDEHLAAVDVAMRAAGGMPRIGSTRLVAYGGGSTYSTGDQIP